MRVLLCWFLATASLCAADGFQHADWQAVVSARVNGIGEVDYAALRAERTHLDRYLEAVAARSPENAPESFPDEASRIAYWINVYNALTVDGVLRDDPFPGVRKVDRFFERRIHTVGGRKMSLDDIEHKTLRTRFAEPRIHFALVCASVSCPRLAPFAFDPERLDEQLEARARLFVSEPRNVSVSGSTVRLSKIFDWFARDFRPSGGVAAFLRARRSDIPADPELRYFDYDWSLNEPGSRARSENPLEREVR